MAELDLAPEDARGSGRSPVYHALWHLFEIGVVTALADFASDGWDAAQARVDGPSAPRRTRVALIDTSVATRHPNLDGAVLHDLSVDFFSAEFGSFPSAAATLPPELSAPMPPPATAGAGALWAELTQGMAARYAASHDPAPGPLRVFPATRSSFSAHGTAMAGLIGARPRGPAEVTLVTPDRLPLPNGDALPAPPPPQALGFAYAGVDPFCQIVPISTNFDPEPRQLILSLLYARLIGADLIVLARDFPVPTALVTPLPGEDPFDLSDPADHARLSTRLGVGLRAAEIEEWRVLEALVVEVSQTIPIVCAAGNAADTVLMYPAVLARPDNGIIAVGAHSSTGAPSAYASGGGAVPITVFAPSGDGERVDRLLQRVDTDSPGYAAADHSAAYLAQLGTVPGGPPGPSLFSPLDIISTDVPGRAGYHGSPFTGLVTETGAVLDYRSYYCRFSGSSAAAAIAGGMLALAYSAGRLTPGDGPGAKDALQGPGAPNFARARPKLHWSNLP